MCIMCVSGTQGAQKVALDPLEMMLQTVVKHQVNPGWSFMCKYVNERKKNNHAHS